MKTPSDITGKIFGKLTTISINHIKKSGAYWDCLCECGRVTVVRIGKLNNGTTRSCGCLVGKAFKHGMAKSSEFGIWENIKTRCYNPKHKWFKRYGGRGIIMCDRWLNSFEAFIADMGLKPGPEYTIERVNNDGNYEPSNCKWATFHEQAVNRCNTVRTTIDGVSMNVRDAAEKLGIKHSAMYMRIKRGRKKEQKGML